MAESATLVLFRPPILTILHFDALGVNLMLILLKTYLKLLKLLHEIFGFSGKT